MTYDDVLFAIEGILRDKLKNKHMAAFSTEARLNEHLYLDSLLMLEVMLAMELDHGVSLPEEAFSGERPDTVDDLVHFYLEVQSPAKPVANTIAELTFARAEQEAAERIGVHGEDYIDIKVHCFVSNVCFAVKNKGLDHRAFFFGVWDADFAIDAQWGLAYHAPEISHDFFRDWFQRLYGAEVRQWYRKDISKEDNVAEMLRLLDTKKPSEHLMVMLDLFHLPERENKFNQNPFPHYLMLEKTEDPAVWMVLDPDFRWEGRIERDKIINAILQPTVAGGFIYNAEQIRVPTAPALRDYFLACFWEDENPLTNATRQIVSAHLEGKDGVKLSSLAQALRELPVLSIRKYGLEHGFAFFWRSMKLSNAEFDVICDDIEALIQEFRSVHYSVLKLSETGNPAHAREVFDRLDTADAMERDLKRRLARTYRIWCDVNGLAHVPQLEADAA